MEQLQKINLSSMKREERIAVLANVLFELARHEQDREWLELVSDAASGARSIIDKAENELHPDLGLTLQEYILFRLDGKEFDEWADKYTEEFHRLMAHIHHKQQQL